MLYVVPGILLISALPVYSISFSWLGSMHVQTNWLTFPPKPSRQQMKLFHFDLMTCVSPWYDNGSWMCVKCQVTNSPRSRSSHVSQPLSHINDGLSVLSHSIPITLHPVLLTKKQQKKTEKKRKEKKKKKRELPGDAFNDIISWWHCSLYHCMSGKSRRTSSEDPIIRSRVPPRQQLLPH